MDTSMSTGSDASGAALVFFLFVFLVMVLVMLFCLFSSLVDEG